MTKVRQCRKCAKEVGLRKDGRMMQHKPMAFGWDPEAPVVCPASGTDYFEAVA